MVTADIEVLENQANLVECEAEFCAGYGGTGSGKTLAAQFKMWKRLRRYPLAGHYVVGADFEQLRGGYFIDFRILLEEMLRWREGRDYRYRDSPRPSIILLDTGARLRTLSSELAERIRSTQIQSLHAEEPQTWTRGEAVWQTLSTRLRHTIRSARAYPDMVIQAWLTYNPKGVPVGSWLYKLVEETWKAKGYPSWRFSLHDNHLLPGLETYIEKIRTNNPPHLWPVEIDGLYPTVGGGAYRSFDHAVHCGKPPDGFPAMGLRPAPLLWTLDFNVAFMCSLIVQPYVQQPLVEYKGKIEPERRLPVPTWQRRTFYIIDEITIPDAGIEDVIDEFLNRYAEHAKQWGVTVYGDPSGGARSQSMSSQSSIRTHYEAIAKRLRERGIRVTFRVQSAHPPIMDRVNLTNAQFRAGTGYGVLVDPLKCPESVQDFQTNKLRMTTKGTTEIDKTDNSPEGLRRTHCGDAFGYLVYPERRLEEAPNSITWTLVR